MPADLKPKLFADAVAAAVSAAAADCNVLSVGVEAQRIAGATGLSPWVVAANLIEAGRRAEVAIELPTPEQLSTHERAQPKLVAAMAGAWR
jgi:hypothetical protein